MQGFQLLACCVGGGQTGFPLLGCLLCLSLFPQFPLLFILELCSIDIIQALELLRGHFGMLRLLVQRLLLRPELGIPQVLKNFVQYLLLLQLWMEDALALEVSLLYLLVEIRVKEGYFFDFLFKQFSKAVCLVVGRRHSGLDVKGDAKPCYVQQVLLSLLR